MAHGEAVRDSIDETRTERLVESRTRSAAVDARSAMRRKESRHQQASTSRLEEMDQSCDVRSMHKVGSPGVI